MPFKKSIVEQYTAELLADLAKMGISEEDFQDSMNWAYEKWLKAHHLEDSEEHAILFTIDVLKTKGHLSCL